MQPFIVFNSVMPDVVFCLVVELVHKCRIPFECFFEKEVFLLVEHQILPNKCDFGRVFNFHSFNLSNRKGKSYNCKFS